MIHIRSFHQLKNKESNSSLENSWDVKLKWQNEPRRDKKLIKLLTQSWSK